MAWPPTIHADVEDTASALRAGWVSGVWLTAPGVKTSPGAFALGTVYFMPILLPPGTLGDLGCYVSTASTAASGGVVNMGLYDTAASLNGTYGRVPGNLLASWSAPISTEVTGAKTATATATLAGGLYWTAGLITVATANLHTASSDAGGGLLNLPGAFATSSFPAQASQTSLPATAAPSTQALNSLRGWVRMSAVT